MSNPFGYQNLNDSQNASLTQYPPIPDHIGVAVPPTPQFIQMQHFSVPDVQSQMSMPPPSMQGPMPQPMQMQMPGNMQMPPMGMQMPPMGMPMGIPLSGPGNQMMMVVPMSPETQLNAQRIREIDFKLDNGYGCYKCWLWFVCIVSIIFALGSLAVLGDPQLRSILWLFIFELMIDTVTAYAFYNGIMALRMKSLEKNELFKKLLIVSSVLYVISNVLVQAETKEITDATSQAYGSEQASQQQQQTSPVVSVIIGLCIRGLVYYTADKISTLLRDRKQLMLA